MQEIYCSTGTVVGRVNGWDYRLIARFGPEIEADGFEFMMEKDYYDKTTAIAAFLEKSGLAFPVMHTDKEIGAFLVGEDPDALARGLALFEANCALAVAIGASRLVLHLWSAPLSDRRFSHNLAALPALQAIADRHRLFLMVENVPCAERDPMTRFAEILAACPGTSFVYDLRFGAFHEQNDAMLTSPFLAGGAVRHVHVSDYVGPPRDFSSLRPIPHLGQGIIGLADFLPRLARVYHGSLTLESPGILPEGCDVAALNADLAFLRSAFPKTSL